MENPPGENASMIHADARGVTIARDAATDVCMEKENAKVGAQPRYGVRVTGGE